MNRSIRTCAFVLCLATLAFGAGDVDAAHQVTAEQLAKQLQASKAPLVLNVGPHTLYQQAHIKGSEYIGAGSSEEGLAKLRERVKALPHSAAIVLYCGCCPWDHCPNVRPAFTELQKMGFSNVKVLYIANNIGADWVDKGYPTEKGM
jgi:thiosulfate/3-mercaptopyruvate sulfurtransferase